ncbi:MAG: type II toxin-antitoxin system VapC family toxin [Hormoscilla sp. GM102CHS1]|nr:type II toxin-antitoxin system VapC family toxin [Hormoscilla sp. GM102CHS1]
MSETVYIETSILGYLTARTTKNAIVASNIALTKDWWELRRSAFTLYVSQLVMSEAARGDAEMAAARLKAISGLPLLEVTSAVGELASQFMLRSNLPDKASDDSIHIALATVSQIDYLLTWNCKHIANAQLQKKLREISGDFGWTLPIICTPYELMGE